MELDLDDLNFAMDQDQIVLDVPWEILVPEDWELLNVSWDSATPGTLDKVNFYFFTCPAQFECRQCSWNSGVLRKTGGGWNNA